MNQRFRLSRAHITFVHDVVMAALSFVAALYLRLGNGVFEHTRPYLWEGTALFAGIAAVVFIRTGVYRGVWRYASLPDLYALAKAVTLTILIFLPVLFLFSRAEDYPRSALVINWFVLMALTGGPRMLYRIAKDGGVAHVLERGGGANAIPVVLYGAGDEAEQFARAMARGRGASYRVVAMVDPGGKRAGQHIRGVDVVDGRQGLSQALAALADKATPAQRLILTFDRVEPEVVREALKACESHGMSLARLGRLTDFAEGGDDLAAIQLKPVALEDLLGRPQTAVDRASIAQFVTGKRILVTGAGGTIGGELCRQIAALDPALIALLDHSEYALYEIDMEIARRFPDVERRAILRDIRNRARLDRALAQVRPDIVFHAAALKHVPLSEENVNEAVLTNVGGTMNVADACREARVQTMVLISTDKAVNPTSVMGATKRLAELYVQALGTADGGTRFAAVRFGNVLGSAGSVVPLFHKQLAEGGPITVTHPDMTRFMMTVREAVELVLQASALGGAGGELFVLDMGEPIRIQDLARQMIRLAGLTPDADVAIAYTGLRPGEKLFEELTYAHETLIATARLGISVARDGNAQMAELARKLASLIEQANAGEADDTRALLRAVLPDYRPPAEAVGAPAKAAAGG